MLCFVKAARNSQQEIIATKAQQHAILATTKTRDSADGVFLLLEPAKYLPSRYLQIEGNMTQGTFRLFRKLQPRAT